MSDRTNGFIVALDQEMRVDDAESTINAIRHIKGVLSVDPIVSDLSHYLAKQQVLSEVRKRIGDVLWKEFR